MHRIVPCLLLMYPFVRVSLSGRNTMSCNLIWSLFGSIGSGGFHFSNRSVFFPICFQFCFCILKRVVRIHLIFFCIWICLSEYCCVNGRITFNILVCVCVCM